MTNDDAPDDAPDGGRALAWCAVAAAFWLGVVVLLVFWP